MSGLDNPDYFPYIASSFLIVFGSLAALAGATLWRLQYWARRARQEQEPSDG
jgi:hypothetical protein